MRICRFIALAAMVTLSVKGAVLTHWYTFNGNVNDQVGSANGTLVGGAIASGGLLSLNGLTSYVQFNL